MFDTLGVTGFQALKAPMLIDSYPLQQAVIASDIPGEMLAGLDELGVSGIAVLADGLRKPIAVKHPVLGLGDCAGSPSAPSGRRSRLRRSGRSVRPRCKSSDLAE